MSIKPSTDKESTTRYDDQQIEKESHVEFPLVKVNFIIMAIAAAAIVIGFLLMLGSGSSAANGFNPDIFSTRRVVVGPTLAFLGFIAMGAGIIYRPKK